ncbi:MAG: hypothetical protein AABN34_11705 [Acidobacteriota bacterium]
MSTNVFDKLIAFLIDLEQRGINYTVAHNRDEGIMVIAAAPGERWEIEFIDDGSVEVERFISDGQICGEEVLAELIARYAREESDDLELPQEVEVVTAGGE